jgi:hypothetical protein
MTNNITIKLISNGATEKELLQALSTLSNNSKRIVSEMITELTPNDDFDGDEFYCFDVDLLSLQ